jgi:hypothetical protein
MSRWLNDPVGQDDSSPAGARRCAIQCASGCRMSSSPTDCGGQSLARRSSGSAGSHRGWDAGLAELAVRVRRETRPLGDLCDGRCVEAHLPGKGVGGAVAGLGHIQLDR